MSMVKEKNPGMDLKRAYPKVLGRCAGIAFLMLVLVAVLFPSFEVRSAVSRPDQEVIIMEPIPETRQIRRPPPPPRPAVPIETESADVPDDVTIASTEVDFDEAPIDLPPPPPSARELSPPSDEEEIVEFWAVERPPEPIERAIPRYPEVARKAGLEGTVFVAFTVGTDGRVRDAQVLRGPEIFRQAALDAIYRFVFRPAVQNDRPVSVRMTMPIRFLFQ